MIDLRDKVTVFHLMVGDKENYFHCVNAINAQDCQFGYEEIRNVAPAAAALQKLIDRCETPYYIQLDEDMILRPHAVSHLCEVMDTGPTKAAILCYPLWDEHIEQAIVGVKIYRLEAMKQVQYRLDAPACEIDINEQLHGKDWDVTAKWTHAEDKEICLGSHGAHYTPATAYEAYFNRAIKSRVYPDKMEWVSLLPAKFRQLMRKEPDNPIHLYALLGYTAGVNVDLAAWNHDKDMRVVNEAFIRLQKELEA
jgi:hypothetical protein